MSLTESIRYGLRNAPYHAHGVLTTRWREVWRAAREIARTRSMPPRDLIFDMVRAQWTLGFTPRDYLCLALQNRPRAERAAWVGTVDMYRAQRIWNPAPARNTLMDKGKFAQAFGGLMDSRRFVVREPRQAPSLSRWIDGLDGSAMISKPVAGQSGKGVLVHSVSRRGAVEVDGNVVTSRWLQFLGLPRVFEPKLENHSTLSDVYSGSLNTVRVLTFRSQSGATRVFATRVRFGRGGHTDNLSAGGIAAAVDEDSGRVTTPAVSSRLSGNERFEEHPETGSRIHGLQLPCWDRVLDLAQEAAAVLPQARSVGWDIALTPSGPLLLEGNHNWCKILWQLPIDQGLRSEMEVMLNE